MKIIASTTWQLENQANLTSLFTLIQQLLESHLKFQEELYSPKELLHIATNLPAPPALSKLSKTFNLSLFEVYTLAFCAATALEPEIKKLCAEIHDSPTGVHPSPHLALQIFPEGSWSAFTPESSLLNWQLITMENESDFPFNPLKIDKGILFYLLGQDYSDSELTTYIQSPSVEVDIILSPSQQEIAKEIAAIWSQASPSDYPIIQIYNGEIALRNAIAHTACKIAKRNTVWQLYLGSVSKSLNGQVDKAITNFNFSALEIRSACTQLSSKITLQANQTQVSGFPNLETTFWQICRSQARSHLNHLAQRIETKASWQDLVLPDATLKVVSQIVSQAQQRKQVYQDWGVASRSKRGLSISALFHGESGTGKTTTAEAIAAELNLDLYRIDLSTIVDKYIGETEKKLSQVFAAAEAGGVILLFDEADALFGKRGRVQEARDRYANQEVSYLLQRLETYQGIVILTTNFRSNIDKAFERRLRFMVEFYFPNAHQRAKIWRRMFSPQTPTKGLDWQKLGQLTVTGGWIYNIALNATFLAAEDGKSVTMKHILLAARKELQKDSSHHSLDDEVANWCID